MSISIFRVAELLDQKIVYTFHGGKRFTACVESLEIHMEDGILRSPYGEGPSPDDALGDYVLKIAGQPVVVMRTSPTTELRVACELTMPADLTAVRERA